MLRWTSRCWNDFQWPSNSSCSNIQGQEFNHMIFNIITCTDKKTMIFALLLRWQQFSSISTEIQEWPSMDTEPFQLQTMKAQQHHLIMRTELANIWSKITQGNGVFGKKLSYPIIIITCFFLNPSSWIHQLCVLSFLLSWYVDLSHEDWKQNYQNNELLTKIGIWQMRKALNF